MTQIDEDRRHVKIVDRPLPWHQDAWDDPEAVDALVVEKPRRSGRKVKVVTFAVGALLIVAMVVGGAVGLWYLREVNPPGDPGTPVNFTVDPSDTLKTVSARLEKDGLVASAGVFRWYVGHHDGLKLTAGYFQIRPSDHMGNVMRVLRTPPSQSFKQVTFPEGYTLARMGTRLNELVPRLTPAQFLAAATDGQIRSKYEPTDGTSLEGLLFPDTYQVANDESAGQVINRMVALMERVGSQENLDAGAAALGRTPYEVLVVASMIEREAKFDVDRAKIARVIYNRLFLDMPLGIDATLRYNQDPSLTFAELKAIDTPYNTYLHTGLPPTPIANPGRASIQAALHPEQNPSQGDPICVALPKKTPCAYLYYVVADEDGHHVFSATLEQQQANIDKARQAGILT